MRQAEKQRKNFQSRIPFTLEPGKKIPKKIEKKKSKKLKNHFPALLLANTGMRQAEKERKNFSSRIPFILGPRKKIPKKIAKKQKKTPFQHYFQPKRNEIGREKEKRILVPNSVHTRPREENSENDSNKIQKLKNLFLALFLTKTRLDRLRKRKKKLVPNSAHTRPGQENSEKNSKKIKKPLSGIIFGQNGDEIGREIVEKNLVSNSVHT